MPTVIGLRDEVRQAEYVEPWDRAGTPIRCDAKSVTQTRVRLEMRQHPGEQTFEAYVTLSGLSVEVDAARMVPVLRAWLARCEEMADLAGRVAEHGAAS